MGFLESLVYYKESFITVTGVYCLSLVLMYIYQAIKRRQALHNASGFLFRMVVILPVVILVGWRSMTTGADTDNFWMEYLVLGKSPLWTVVLHAENGDLLYQLMAWVICKISNANVHIYFAIVAALTLYFVVLTIDKWNLRYSTMAWFLFLFCYGPNLGNQMREMLAVAIMLLGYWYLFQDKKKAFILWSAVATFIHLSALAAAIIAFLIITLNKRKRKGYKFYIILVLATVFCQPVAKVLGMLLFSGTSYYDKYFLVDAQMSVGLGMLLTIIPLVIPAFVLHRHLDKEGRILKMISVTIPARYVGYNYYFVSRMHYYFSGMGIIGLAMALENVSKRNRIFVRWFIIFMVFVYYLTFYFWKDAYTYFPYVFITSQWKISPQMY